MMKKTTFGAVLAFLFAAAGALTAAALYLYHREKELDEYERLLSVTTTRMTITTTRIPPPTRTSPPPPQRRRSK